MTSPSNPARRWRSCWSWVIVSSRRTVPGVAMGYPRLASEASHASRSSGLGRDARPRRRVLADGLVATGPLLEDALAHRQARAAGAGAAGRARPAARADTCETPFGRELAGHATAEAAEGTEHARRGRRRELQGQVREGLAHPRAGAREGGGQHELGQAPVVGGGGDRRGVAALGHRDSAIGHLPAGQTLVKRLVDVRRSAGSRRRPAP